MKQNQITNELRLLELVSSIAVVTVVLLILFVLIDPQSRPRTMAARISGGNILRQVSFTPQSPSFPIQPVGSSK
jgi:hypothetical protein